MEEAAEIASKNLGEYSKISELRDQMEDIISSISKDTVIFSKDAPRLPNTSMLNMPGHRRTKSAHIF
ncbi:MAG UNVERIFIED_CONTAM: hypothetical protein LVQ98_06085 [Rickettsiaceae bacterium]